jgi:hypothetical protein
MQKIFAPLKSSSRLGRAWFGAGILCVLLCSQSFAQQAGSSSGGSSGSSESPSANNSSNDTTPGRVLWIFPSFNVTDDLNAPALTARQKLVMAVRTVLDPVTITESAIKAGIYQSEDAPPGYGAGFEGYAKRLGASYTDMASMRMLGMFAFPALLHQDPRYFRKNHGGVRRRLLYALSQLVVTRTDSGHETFNSSNFLANVGSAGLSCTYYPEGNCHFGIFMANLGWGFLTRGVGNGLREFWPDIHRHFTSRKNTSPVP